jgi:glutamyl-tRNA synthetase
MIALFDIHEINKAASTFNPDKLLWLNQHYIKAADPMRLAHLLGYHMGQLGIDPVQGPELVAVARTQHERAKTLKEMAEISKWIYRDFETYDEAAAKKHLRPVALEPLKKVRAALAELEDWAPEPLHAAVAAVAEALSVNMGKVAQPLRVAVVGRAASPGIDETLHLVGREAALRRIDWAIEYVKARAVESA